MLIIMIPALGNWQFHTIVWLIITIYRNLLISCLGFEYHLVLYLILRLQFEPFSSFKLFYST